MSKRTLALFLVVALGAFASQASAAVDGKLDGSDSYGLPVAVQDTPTGFGNNVSELDAAYARLDGLGNLSLLITGNLEGNGNGIVIFIDSRAGGGVASTLMDGSGVLGSVGGTRIDDWGTDVDGGSGMNPTPGGGSILDLGFNPDIGIEINAAGGASYYVNVIDLAIPNNGDPNVDFYLGTNALGGAAAAPQVYLRPDMNAARGYLGAVTHAFDNSNSAGVTDLSAAGALTANTGAELQFSANFLAADPGHAMKAMVVITNGGGEYLSNQLLGAAGLAGSPNLESAGGVGGIPLFDARQFVGNQFFHIPQVPEPEGGALALLAVAAAIAGRRSS